MIVMLAILLAASIGIMAAKAFRLPQAPLLILGGSLLDVFNVPMEFEFAQDALLLGLTFLVFLSGTALNPWRIGPKGKLALIIGACQFFLLGGLGFFISSAAKFSPMESFYLGLALASSSTLVVIRILQARGELFDPFGRLLVGALLIQDVLMMIVISGLSRFGEGAASVFASGALSVSLVMAGAAFKKWLGPVLFLRKNVDEEQQLVLALGILFVFMGAASLLKLPFLTGAFVAGISLSSFPVSGILKGQFASLNTFFSAVFFVTLGFFVNFPSSHNLTLVLGLALLVALVTPALAAGIAWMAGLSIRSGLETGLMLAQTGEFSIILALIGMENGHLMQEHLGLVTSITVVTMILTPFISHERVVNRLMSVILKFAPKDQAMVGLSGHIVLLGCGESGSVVMEDLLKRGKDVVVVDDDIGVVRKLRERGVPVIFGNGKDPRALEMAGVGRARLAVSSMRKFSDNTAVLGYAKEVPKIFRVFDSTQAKVFEKAGAAAIPVSEVAAQELLEWIESKEQNREK